MYSLPKGEIARHGDHVKMICSLDAEGVMKKSQLALTCGKVGFRWV